MNEELIAILGKELRDTAEKLTNTAERIVLLKGKNEESVDAYEHFLLDEISHVQLIALEMTRLASEGEQESNTDESAFLPGELNSVIGEKKREYPLKP